MNLLLKHFFMAQSFRATNGFFIITFILRIKIEREKNY